MAAGNLPLVVANAAPTTGNASTTLAVTPSNAADVTLTLTHDGNGTTVAAPAPNVEGTRYSVGTVVTLTPQIPAGVEFVGWRVDGVFQG